MFKYIPLLPLLLLVFGSLSLSAQSSAPVRFSFGTEHFPANYEMERQKSIEKDEITNGKYIRFIQADRLLTTRERQLLQEAGVQVLEYFDFATYLLSIPEQFDLKQLEKFQVKSIVPVKALWKLARNLREQPYGAWAIKNEQLVVNVVTYPHVPLADALSFFQKSGLTVLKTGTDAAFVQLLLPPENLENIAALPFVQFMELLPPPAEAEDRGGRSMHRSNILDSDAPSGKKYNGENIGVLVRDDGQVGPHIDFQGRLNNISTQPPEAGTHGDGVSGILTGAGNLNPVIKGMASGARLFAVNYTDDFQNGTIDLFLNQNVTITNSSYSNGCNSGYTFTSQIVDKQMYDYPTLLHVFSAGNANGNDCGAEAYGAGPQWGNITGGHKQGKNSIAVANILPEGTLVNSSSRGPAYDGRIKPDIAAVGNGQASTAPFNGYQDFSGTSGAAPGIAGCSAQLAHAYKTLHNGQEPAAALLKILLLNSANDLGNAGPDYKFGWGHVNAGRALRLLETGSWSENEVDNAATVTQSLIIPEGVRQAKVMLYWPETSASVVAAQAVINDLDITLVAADGTVYQPWKLNPTPDPVLLDTPAAKGRDSLNNVEQVAINNPPAGAYTIRVQGSEVPLGPQPFYLSWEMLSDSITLTYPNGGEGFVPGETERLHWDAYGSTENFVLTYSTDNGANWQTISTVSAPIRIYNWTVPNTISGSVLVRIQRGSQSDSNDAPFSIVRVPQNISFAQVCPDSMKLNWTDIQDTLSYDVYLLGTKYMDLTGSSAVNSFTFPIMDPQLEKWVSVRAQNNLGLSGRRAIAVKWDGGLLNCPQPEDLALRVDVGLENNTIASCGPVEQAVKVKIENVGTNVIAGAIINYQFDNEAVVSEPLTAIPVGSTLDFVFQTPLYLSGNQRSEVVVWATYPGDDYRYNDTLAYSIYYVTQPATNYFTEDFDGSGFPAGWRVENPDAAITWVHTGNTITGSDGNDTRTLFLNCFAYESQGETDYIYTIPLDLNAVSDPGISFDVAHAAYNADYQETLLVEVFANCDLDAEPVIVWQKTDPALATVPNSTNAFAPDAASDWRREYIDLQQFAGQSVFVRFSAVNGYGNNIFLDNINLIEFDFETPEALLSASTDSICRNDTMYFEAIVTGTGMNTYSWNFGSGAAPLTATGPGPHAVRYLLSGSKTPRLIASNLLASDTATSQVFVRALPTTAFTFQPNDLTVTFSNNTQNADSYLWNFGDDQTSTEANPVHTYDAPGNYIVKLSATNVCRTVDKSYVVVLTSGTSVLPDDVSVRIVPNPTAGDFRVELSGNLNGTALLSLLDVQGKLLKSIETSLHQSTSVVPFENLALPKGVYQLNVLTEQGFRTLRVAVQ